MRLWPRIALLLVCLAALCPAQATSSQDGPTPAATEARPAPENVRQNAPESEGKADAPASAKPTDTTPVTRPNPAVEPPPARRSGTAAASAEPPGKAASAGGPTTEKPYIIGPLDVLYIRVWNNQNLTGMVDVRPDGMISLALIGEIKADGLTVPQLVDVLKVKLSEFFISPEIDVQVTKPNSKKFLIIGEVGRPGEYPLVGKTSILEALSGAGLRETANLKKIYLLRGTVKHFFNYKDVIDGKHLEQDIPVENGDRIVVPQ